MFSDVTTWGGGACEGRCADEMSIQHGTKKEHNALSGTGQSA